MQLQYNQIRWLTVMSFDTMVPCAKAKQHLDFMVYVNKF